eukprot:NODE_347_length_9026_cov_0.640641.p6 type:complete len:156 gc:universal NODE_347_length_9026_cov_0.640641:4786-5253(+)
MIVLHLEHKNTVKSILLVLSEFIIHVLLDFSKSSFSMFSTEKSESDCSDITSLVLSIFKFSMSPSEVKIGCSLIVFLLSKVSSKMRVLATTKLLVIDRCSKVGLPSFLLVFPSKMLSMLRVVFSICDFSGTTDILEFFLEISDEISKTGAIVDSF